MHEEELRASARFEALDRFGVEESDVVIHHAPLDGASPDRRSVMLFAVPQGVVRSASALAMGAGLVPASVEHAALASLRGIERWQGESQLGLVACLHIEAHVATLMLLRDGALAQMRFMEGDWQVAASAPVRPTFVQDADAKHC
jgi:Tfp pilus assembly PilM family ATPase